MVSEEELAKEIVTELLKRYSKHGMTKEEARTYGARFEGVTRSENEHVRRVWYDNHLKSILQKAANSGDNKAQACLQGRFYEEVKEKKQDEKTKRKQAKAQEKTAKAQLETAEAEKAAAPLKLFPHGAFDVLIIVGIINHLSDWWFWGFQKTGMSFLFDFLIAFFTFLFAFGPFNDKGNINVKGASACIVAWFIEVELFPMLGSRIIGTSTPTLIKVLLAKHLWPVWVFFGLMYTGKTEGGFTWIAKFARWCLAVFWIFILITPMKAYMMDAYLEDMSEEQREEVFGAVTESFNESKTSWAAVWECWRHSIFGLGAGQAGAYEKCIEEKRNPPEKQTQYEVARSEDSIIVALKPIKSKKTFKAEEDIKVSAVFEIKSESKDVKIEGASCSFNKGPKGKEEKVVQGVAKFEGIGIEGGTFRNRQFDLTCELNKGALEEGEYTPVFNVDLAKLDNKATWELYFMYKDTLDEYIGHTRQPQELIKKIRASEEFGELVGGLTIGKRGIVSTCDGGVVCLNLGRSKELITPPIYGITPTNFIKIFARVKNQNKGKIRKQGKITLTVPEGFEAVKGEGENDRCKDFGRESMTEEGDRLYELESKIDLTSFGKDEEEYGKEFASCTIAVTGYRNLVGVSTDKIKNAEIEVMSNALGNINDAHPARFGLSVDGFEYRLTERAEQITIKGSENEEDARAVT